MKKKKKALIHITLQLIAINPYAYTMYVCVCTQEKPIEIQSSFVLSSAECLSLYYFSLSRHPTALLSLSLSRSLFLSSTRKLTYVFACCSFLDEVKRECTSAREREKERKKEKRISCLPAAVCLILICSTKKEKKKMHIS